MGKRKTLCMKDLIIFFQKKNSYFLSTYYQTCVKSVRL